MASGGGTRLVLGSSDKVFRLECLCKKDGLKRKYPGIFVKIVPCGCVTTVKDHMKNCGACVTIHFFSSSSTFHSYSPAPCDISRQSAQWSTKPLQGDSRRLVARLKRRTMSEIENQFHQQNQATSMDLRDSLLNPRLIRLVIEIKLVTKVSRLKG